MGKRGRRPGTPKTGGRQKGTPNKVTGDLKAAILAAAEAAGNDYLPEGGMTAYLHKQAQMNPVAFLSLLGKVLPTQIAGDPDNPILHEHTVEAAFGEAATALDELGRAKAGSDLRESKVAGRC